MIETAPYRVSRSELARLASAEYVRNFWWLVATIPLFGLLAVIFGYGPLQVIGYFAIMWPFSIPARSVLSTRKASKLFSNRCRLVMHEDRLEFLGTTPQPSGRPLRMVVPVEEVRKVTRRNDFLVVQTRHFGFAPIAISAFGSPEQIAAVQSIGPASP